MGRLMGIEPTHIGATIRRVTTSPQPPHLLYYMLLQKNIQIFYIALNLN